MSPELQSALAALLGGFGMLILKEWIPGVVRWFTGSSARQKSLIQAAEAEVDRQKTLLQAAEDEIAQTSRNLQKLEVHATALTRYLVSVGWDPADGRLKWPY